MSCKHLCYRYGRDHGITVDILRYDNPKLKAQVLAELVVLKTCTLDSDPQPLAFARRPKALNSEDLQSSAPRSKRRKATGKDNEIQGALALMELARN